MPKLIAFASLFLATVALLGGNAFAQQVGPAATDQGSPQLVSPPLATPLVQDLAPPQLTISPPPASLAAPTPAPTPVVPVLPPQAQAVPPPLPPAITPPPLPPAAQYFYNNNGTPAGPFSLADISGMITSGAIKSDTLVWQTGTPNWVAAKDLPPVAALLPAVTRDFATYLLGTWQSQGAGPAGTVGPATLTLNLSGGGQLSGFYSVTWANTSAPATYPVSGSWSASKIDENRANLALNMQILANGQLAPYNSSSLIEVVDANTIRDTADGTTSTRIGH